MLPSMKIVARAERRCDDMLVKGALDVVTEAVNGALDPLVSKVSLFKASSLSGDETHGRAATIC